MKRFILVFTTLVSAALAQADECQSVMKISEGYSLSNPISSLKENECVFEQKNIPAYQGFKFIINACDSKVISSLSKINASLTLKYGRLLPDNYVYNVVQTMTGNTIFRVMISCSNLKLEQQIIPQDNIVDEEIGAMPPPPAQAEEKAVKKPVVKQKITKKETVEPQQAQPAQNGNVEKDNQDTPEIKNYVPPAIDTDF